MSDSEKSKPVDDLKQGLNLLFRAAKGAVDAIPTDKIEGALKDGAKEVGKAFEQVATEVDKVFHKDASKPASTAPGASNAGGRDAAQANAGAPQAPKPDETPFDDAYAPEPPRGPRIG